MDCNLQEARNHSLISCYKSTSGHVLGTPSTCVEEVPHRLQQGRNLLASCGGVKGGVQAPAGQEFAGISWWC
jgi:hypothetical protein